MAGDDTVLPCQLNPPMDAGPITLEWGRLDLSPSLVYLRLNGKDLLTDQNTAYRGKSVAGHQQNEAGRHPLTLSKVKVSDTGRYTCFLPQQQKEHLVELVVGAASSPVISLAGTDRDKGSVVLQCESKGWYPEPELLWLDAEGELLSAGPTQTVRGPDDLYTVSSRVTVEKTHSNSFTCRVQQKTINQTRDTQIHIAGEEEKPAEDQALLESKRREALYKDKTNLDEKLKTKEEEQRDVVQMKHVLEEVNDKVTELKRELKEKVEKTQSEQRKLKRR
ncbi:hypothetical protein INR49_020768 [Caranx melampygus]|nr:hypothetical protein INR49_020768 [Caranx melampygus]